MNSLQKKIYDQQCALLVGQRERSGIKYIMGKQGNEMATGNSIVMYQYGEFLSIPKRKGFLHFFNDVTTHLIGKHLIYKYIFDKYPEHEPLVVAKWTIRLK